MSRIRSIHPGLWTDEAFMSLSAYARLLYIGLWNEAYDDGVFEWKPLTLKAKIFPVDTVDVKALLTELVEAGCIREGISTGKSYGLIRNFRIYQRPKKPNSSGLLQPKDHEYVGLVLEESGTGTELSPQMEDGGGEKEEGVTKPSASSARATRWPKGQKVPDDWKAWAKTSFPSVEAYRLTTETRQFEDYWPGKIGKDGLRADWEAEYHMWLRRKFGADEVVEGSGAGDPGLVVLGPDDDDFKLVQAVRGKPIVLGKSGKTTISVAEVRRAREVAGLQAH